MALRLRDRNVGVYQQLVQSTVLPHLTFLASDSMTQQTFSLSLLLNTRQESQLAADETSIGLFSPNHCWSGLGNS